MITAEEFFRTKIKELNLGREVITTSLELITAEQGLRWAHEFMTQHTADLQKKLSDKQDQIESLEELLKLHVPDMQVKYQKLKAAADKMYGALLKLNGESDSLMAFFIDRKYLDEQDLTLGQEEFNAAMSFSNKAIKEYESLTNESK